MEKTKKIAEVSVAVALAVVFHFLKIYTMPQGGDVSLTMVPIIFIAFRRGPLSGAAAGVIYGIINIMLDGVVYHPLSVLLDYILAFGILGIAGFFQNKLSGVVCGTVAAVAGRFICSFISGAVLFGTYAPEGQSPWIYSFVYQAAYIVPELIICLVVMIVLFVKAKILFVQKTKSGK